MKVLERVLVKIKEFNEIQKKYAEFGGRDTEPDAEFQLALSKALKGKKEVPRSADDWALYGHAEGEMVAYEMTTKTNEIVKLITHATISEHERLKDGLAPHLWRIR